MAEERECIMAVGGGGGGGGFPWGKDVCEVMEICRMHDEFWRVVRSNFFFKR